MKNNSVFLLIKTLSKSEKRHFKLYTQAFGNGKNLIELFDAINKLKIYNEKELKKNLLHNKLAKNLAITKNQLYYQILKSLSSSDNKSNDIEKQKVNNNAYFNILRSKGLSEDALVFLNKNEKIANSTEDFLLQYNILEIKRKVKKHKSAIAREAYLKIIFEKQYLLINQQRELIQYKELWNKFSIQEHKSYFPRLQKDKKIIESILKNKLLLKKYKPLSIVSYSYKQSILIDCNKYLRNFNEAFQTNSELFQQRIDNEFYYKKPLSYISQLYNFQLITLEAKKYEVFQSNNLLFDLVSLKNADIKNRLFERKLLLNLSYFKKTLQLQQGIEYFENAKPEIKNNWKNATKIHIANSLLNIATIYFYNEDFKTAQDIFLEIDTTEAFNDFTQYKTLAKIAILFCRFELNQKRFLDSYINSLTKYLQFKKREFKMETIILKRIGKMINLQYSGDIRMHYKLLLKSLLPLLENSFEKIIFEEIDYISFIESRIKNTSTLAILKEKTKTN